MAENMHLQAKFVQSSEKLFQCPPADIPEYAFIGRSNVGKSSLINYICNQKSLAMTSGKPGKTKLINHFLVNDEWFLVDLPGFGYAQISKKERQKFEKMILDYLQKRPNLVFTFLLIDGRIPPQEIDLEFAEWLGIHEIPFGLVFTKVDKSGGKNMEQIEAFKAKMLENWEELPPFWISSSSKQKGKEGIIETIFEFNAQFSDVVRERFENQ